MRSLSFSYPQVDEKTRAELATGLLKRPALPGVFVLTTCLRTEVIIDSETDPAWALSELFGDMPATSTGKTREGSEAAIHLFRVAAGLESPILGESEILTQLRQAVRASLEHGGIPGLLEGLLNTAISVGRQARELLPDSPHDSLASVAAQAVGGADRVAVFGSGIMATSVIKALRSLPAPPIVTVAARRPDSVAVEGVEVTHFDKAAELLADHPAVVSATSAKRRPVPDEVLSRVARERSSPLILVDMAMPPDFKPVDSATLEYLNIDDLARMADRRPRSEAADEFVKDAALKAYSRYVSHGSVGPVIAGMMQQAENVVTETVGRFANRLSDPEDVEVLRQTAHTVARTLLARPVEVAKQSDSDALATLADALCPDRE